jgi:hypothetical protein
LQKLRAYKEVDHIERENNRYSAENLFTMSFIYGYHLGDMENSAKHFQEGLTSKRIIDSEGALEYWDNLQLLNYSEKQSLAFYYARNGYSKLADSLMNEVYDLIDITDSLKLRKYWNSIASIEFEKGNYDSALFIIINYPIPDSTFVNLLIQARVYYATYHLNLAVQLYDKLLVRYDKFRAWNSSFGVLLHYWAGLAYEEASMYEQAAEQYEKFLDIWKNADPGIEEIDDAKTRLRRLENLS